MALFRPILGELSGSIANNVFSRNRFGAYVRNRSKPVDPFTPAQQAQRQLMQESNVNWKLLTAAERNAWINYAANTPVVNRLGDQIFLTGRQMYLKNNLFIGNFPTGANEQSEAPITPGFSANPIFTLTGTEADGVEIQSLSLNADGDQFQLFVSPPIAQTRNYYNGPWVINLRQTGVVAIPTTAVPSASSFIGQRYAVAIRRWEDLTMKIAESRTLNFVDILA